MSSTRKASPRYRRWVFFPMCLALLPFSTILALLMFSARVFSRRPETSDSAMARQEGNQRREPSVHQRDEGRGNTRKQGSMKHRQGFIRVPRVVPSKLPVCSTAGRQKAPAPVLNSFTRTGSECLCLAWVKLCVCDKRQGSRRLRAGAIWFQKGKRSWRQFPRFGEGDLCTFRRQGILE